MENSPEPGKVAEASEIVSRVRRLLRCASSRAALPYLAAVLALIVAIAAGGREIEHHLTAIESWITKLGPWGILAFVGLFVVMTSCLLPDTVLCIIAGALFGIGWGVAAVVAGALLASATQFALARRLLKNRIERALASRPSLAAIQRAVKGDEFRLQVLLRLTPLNPATVSYLLGATGVRFPAFLVACLATTPSLILEVYFGRAGKHAARLAGSGGAADHRHDLLLFGGLGLGILLLYAVSKMARQALATAVGEIEARTSGPAGGADS